MPTSIKDSLLAIVAIVILLAGGFIGFVAGNYYGYSKGVVDGVRYQYSHTMKQTGKSTPSPQGGIAPIVDPTGATAIEVIGALNDAVQE